MSVTKDQIIAVAKNATHLPPQITVVVNALFLTTTVLRRGRQGGEGERGYTLLSIIPVVVFLAIV